MRIILLVLLLLPLSAHASVAPEKSALLIFNQLQHDWAHLWGEHYSEPYNPARLIIYKRTQNTPCGAANGEPFYCPANAGIYISQAKIEAVRARAPYKNDFALAYLIAHEFAHHMQTIGQTYQGKMQLFLGSASAQHQALIRLEHTADCMAGVWASYQNGYLSGYSIKTGIMAALDVRSDTQHTEHGSADARIDAFTFGYTKKHPAACNGI